MKRLILLLGIVFVAMPVFAFRTSLSEGDRVGVLRPTVADPSDEWIARAVSSYLTNALRHRGLDAFDARMHLDDLINDGRTDADYYVEVVSGNGDSIPHGGISVGDGSSGVDLAWITSRVAARMRLYDGRTLQMIDEYDLQEKNTLVLPTAVGVGRRYFAAWIALPIVQHVRYRAAARAVANNAAERIAVETGK